MAERIGGSVGLSSKSIIFHSVELCEWIKGECGHLSRYKYLPKWLKNSDTEILKIVFDTMIKGDGWNGPSGCAYRSISHQLLQDIGEIAQKLGYGVTFMKGNETVMFRIDQTTPTVNSKPKVMRYKGKIYCCEVPNGLIYVRRNGKTLWTHNSYAVSYRIQKVIESLSGGEKPQVMFFGHTHKSTYLFDRNIHCYSMGCIESQSKWMRGKRISAHTGFWIIDLWVNEQGVSKAGSTFYPFYT